MQAYLGEYKKALNDFSRTIELNPKFAKAYFHRGEVLYIMEDFRASLTDYNTAVTIEPNFAEAFNSRGHTNFRLKNYRASVKDFTEAIRLNPKNAVAYTNRGDLYSELGYFAEAINDYQKAITADPNFGRVYQSAAWLLATCPKEKFRNPTRAVKLAKQAIQLDGQNHQYVDTLAAAQASDGQFLKAQEIQQQAIQLAPKAFHTEYQERMNIYASGRAFAMSPRDAPGVANQPKKVQRK